MTLQERKKTEALERLSQLEKLYGLNPKVRKYFAEGKLLLFLYHRRSHRLDRHHYI